MGIHSANAAGAYAAAMQWLNSSPSQEEPVSNLFQALDQARENGPLRPSIEDELLLSPEARAAETSPGAMFGKAQLFPGMSRPADGRLHLADLRGQFGELQTSLNTRIRDALAASGIDTSQQVRLQIGYDGSVIAAGDHPQNGEIEQVFRDQPELRNQFARVSGLGSFLHAAEEHAAFQKAYAQDPYTAVQQYSHLFNDQPRPDYTLLLQGDEAWAEFLPQ